MKIYVQYVQITAKSVKTILCVSNVMLIILQRMKIYACSVQITAKSAKIIMDVYHVMLIIM